MLPDQRVDVQIDVVSKESVATHENGTVRVQKADGSFIVQFSDGTRITSMADQATYMVECVSFPKIVLAENVTTLTLMSGTVFTYDKHNLGMLIIIS